MSEKMPGQFDEHSKKFGNGEQQSSYHDNSETSEEMVKKGALSQEESKREGDAEAAKKRSEELKYKGVPISDAERERLRKLGEEANEVRKHVK